MTGIRITSGGRPRSRTSRRPPHLRSRGRWPPPARPTRTAHEFHHPLDRVTGRLPRRLRIAVDWIVTIVGAVAIVLAIKAWVINPYRIPSSSMESTLHCARPAAGCESRFSDRVLANRFVYHFTRSAARRRHRLRDAAGREGEVRRGRHVREADRRAARARRCGIRIHGGAAYVYIDGQRLEEPYIEKDRRDIGPAERFQVPARPATS